MKKENERMEQTYFDKTVPQALEQVKATANGLTAQEAARLFFR